MTSKQRVTQAVFRAVDEINAQLPADAALEKSEGVPIVGDAASLDSLGFLNLLVIAERELEAEFGTELRLTEDDTIMLDGRAATLGELIDYVAGQVDAEA